jgi:hypothetical protein
LIGLQIIASEDLVTVQEKVKQASKQFSIEWVQLSFFMAFLHCPTDMAGTHCLERNFSCLKSPSWYEIGAFQWMVMLVAFDNLKFLGKFLSPALGDGPSAWNEVFLKLENCSSDLGHSFYLFLLLQCTKNYMLFEDDRLMQS